MGSRGCGFNKTGVDGLDGYTHGNAPNNSSGGGGGSPEAHRATVFHQSTGLTVPFMRSRPILGLERLKSTQPFPKKSPTPPVSGRWSVHRAPREGV